GIRDNFFDLGGDSILSIRLKTLAQARGLQFDLADLFACPMIDVLAAALDRREATQHAPKIAPFDLITPEVRALLPEDVEDAYPLSRMQAGMVFHSKLAEASGVYHDVITYRLNLPFNEVALRESLAQLATRHEILRTSFTLTIDNA